MDVVDGDERNASHVWIRQAVTWTGRAYTGGEQPWLLGPTKGKRFRKVAVSPPVFDRLRLHIDAHARGAKALIFDYPLLRAEHAARKDADPGRSPSPPAGTSTRRTAVPVRTARRTPTPSGAAARTAAMPTPRPGSGPAARRAPSRWRRG